MVALRNSFLRNLGGDKGTPSNLTATEALLFQWLSYGHLRALVARRLVRAEETSMFR
jgi:hypothetical protein